MVLKTVTDKQKQQTKNMVVKIGSLKSARTSSMIRIRKKAIKEGMGRNKIVIGETTILQLNISICFDYG